MKLDSAQTILNDLQKQLKYTNEQIHYAGQYYATRSTQAGFMKAWNKGRYRVQHKEELERYDEAVSYFRENADEHIPAMQELRDQKTQLTEAIEKQKDSIKSLGQTERTWKTAVSNIESLLGPMPAAARSSQVKKDRSRHTDPAL